MKLTQYNTKIFDSELATLVEHIDETRAAITAWLKVQEEREKYGTVDQNFAQGHRQYLESRLNELRDKMAVVYDFQGYRGMCDFVPSGFTILEDDPPEPEPEDNEIDFGDIDLGFHWGNEPAEVVQEKETLMIDYTLLS